MGIGGIRLPKLRAHPLLLHAQLDPEHEEYQDETDDSAHLGERNRGAGFLGTAIALSQVRGVICFVLVFLMFWVKLRMEEQWMRSQFGETYATYAHQTATLVPYLF